MRLLLKECAYPILLSRACNNYLSLTYYIITLLYHITSTLIFFNVLSITFVVYFYEKLIASNFLDKKIVFRYSSNSEREETRRENHYSSLRRDGTRKPLFVPSKGRDEKTTTRPVPSNSLISKVENFRIKIAK